MYTAKLLQLLQSFSAQEMKQLRKLVMQKADNKDVLTFFEQLYALYPNYSIENTDKRRVFKRMYPHQPYNDQRMRHLMAELQNLAENYLVGQTLEIEPFLHDKIMLRQYRKRNLTKLFDQQLRQLKGQLEIYPTRDETYYEASLLTDKEFNQYLKGKQLRTIEPNLQQLSNTMDQWYVVGKLKIFIEALNYQNLVTMEYNIRFMGEILRLIKEESYLEIPIIGLHYAALMTLLEPENGEHFNQLKQNLEEHNKILNGEDLDDLYTVARNYCIKKINQGHSAYIREVFELYRFELRHQKKQHITASTYKNIVTVAYSLHEYEFARQFIETYTPLLPEHSRLSNYQYNMARYRFVKGEYREVVGLLAQVDYDDVFLMLSAKALLLKTYFELQATDAFYSLTQSFRALLRNKKYINYHKRNYLNLLFYAEKLYSCSKRERSRIKDEILSVKELMDKDWLLEKCV
ncbi:MAG: hypothetical protein SFW35_14120 [Chitinophagales bacterium]|nr:hypothetical protein [Chitinophagales bacterium]